MPRGYEEGPIAEEVERRLDELRRGVPDVAPTAERAAVFGVTGDDPTSHFIGWLGEVDPETLFESGEAWGLTVRSVGEKPT